jgi:hypothetical protein
MSVVVVVLTLMLLAGVMAVVSRPLLTARALRGTGTLKGGSRGEGDILGGAGRQAGDHVDAQALGRAEIEAAREAKYREIRDAELDYRTGKLSNEDYEAINGALRAEAVEILDRLQAIDQETYREPGATDERQDG